MVVAKKVKVLKVKHRGLGLTKVKLDQEDISTLSDGALLIKRELSREVEPFVIFKAPGQKGYDYAARVILESHNLLDYTKNVYYKDGDHYNLSKKNIYQA